MMTIYAVIVTRSLILAGLRMQVDVPTIELVDLPGIQLYPQICTNKPENWSTATCKKRTLLFSVSWTQLSPAWIAASQ